MSSDGIDNPAIVYISGPMSGQPNHGVPVFEAARDALRARGYSVLCPSECSLVQNLIEQRLRPFHLRRDAQMVLIADEVCVLDGWENSKGAVWEVSIALALDIPVWEYSTGHRIDGAIAEHFDIRRGLIPIDFEEWSEDGDTEGALEPVPGPTCSSTTVPYRGASIVRCIMREGHGGEHRDAAGVGW